MRGRGEKVEERGEGKGNKKVEGGVASVHYPHTVYIHSEISFHPFRPSPWAVRGERRAWGGRGGKACVRGEVGVIVILREMGRRGASLPHSCVCNCALIVYYHIFFFLKLDAL